MRIASLGHAVFATTIIAIGILGLINGDLAAIWQPIPKGIPARDALLYLCILISLASGLGLLWQRTATLAARALLVWLLLWLVVFKVHHILLAPTVAVSYESCGETAVIVAGAWILYVWFAAAWDKQRLGFATGSMGVRIARVLYGLSLIAFGLSHVAYAKETAALVPAWLPWHVAWTYVTGGAYIAAGVAVLIGLYARLAAVLSTWQMGMFTLLVWVPIVAAEPTASSCSELIVSWALTASGWVVADSYRDMPWFAVGKR